MKRTNRLASRIIAIIIAVFIVLIVSNIFMMSYNTKKSVKATLGEHSVTVAQNMAQYMDVEGYKQLANSPQENELYWRLREQLNDLREKNGVLYAYTFAAPTNGKEGNGVFLVDGMPADDHENAATISSESSATSNADLLRALEDGYYYTDVIESEFGQFISGTIPVKDANGEVAFYLGIDIDADYVDVVSSLISKEIIPTVVIIFSLISILGLAILYYYINSALRPLKSLKESATYLAEGNIKDANEVVSHINMSNGNEISLFARDFTDALGQLSATFETIHSKTNSLEQVVEDINATAHHVSESNNTIAASVTQIAEGSGKQQISNDEVMQAMSEMAIGIQRLADTTSDIAESSSDMTELVEKSTTNSKQVVQQIHNVESSVVRTSEQVREMGARFHSIEEMVTVITSIADQTNLLALNAAIEAARAGEAGKGFAVVADEVRKLAEMSRTSADDIHHHLQSFLEIAERALSEMAVSTEEVKEGSLAVTAIGENLESILQSVLRVNNNIQENSAVIEQMSASSEEILASAEDMNQLVTNTTTQTQEVAQSIDIQVDMVEKLSEVVEQLDTTSKDVITEIEKFKL
ncbi:methyl-accepting chemotaxis protein [Metasolibacillus sp. FSL H7-0170]|uniref:methyl-accepting chemotaxis protein n=1 Tax=Metasolibacillus TaxID=2703677 RepID=UPI00079919A0|nr:methyl-accepting chemotaxis protein [Metasolibacillus fluoroglycofenilyticus]KYG89695.1 chemotaxis protein [[Bacillus] sp. KCTC 13219]